MQRDQCPRCCEKFMTIEIYDYWAICACVKYKHRNCMPRYNHAYTVAKVSLHYVTLTGRLYVKV